jgi:serine/threonine protein kinase
VNFPTEKSYDCCGTVSYSAPEIFENKPYDLTVDIWSYGVILHVFQFNRYPIESKTFVKDIIKGELFFFFMKMEEKGKKYWDENVIKKLIFRTLVKEPCKRISGSEIEKILQKEIRE